MCKAFSCVITKSKKVYWKAGIDSHSDILDKFEKKDIELKDNKLPPNNTFARVEITPDNRDYLTPDNWSLKIDEDIIPRWWDTPYEKYCFNAFKKWKKKVYTFNVDEVKNPIHPFQIKAQVTEKDKDNARKFYSVWDSVKAFIGDSVWSSVCASVGDSIRASVGYSVWNSVGHSVLDSLRASVKAPVLDSVRASVRAYVGSLFSINKWKCIKYKKGEYPFQSSVDLWKRGLVMVVYDNKIRLFGSPDGDGKVKELWSEIINN